MTVRVTGKKIKGKEHIKVEEVVDRGIIKIKI